MTSNLILIDPPHTNARNTGNVSLALLYLAGAARDVCDNIKIFDYNVPVGIGKTTEDLMNTIKDFPSKDTKSFVVVGINCLYSALFPSVRDIAKKVKEEYPFAKIVIGGMHPTIFAKDIINNCQEIDAVAIGEADVDFPKLLRHFYYNESIDDIEGFCLRVAGETVFIARKQYIQDLGSLPRPGYEYYDFDEYTVDTSHWWDPDGIGISPFFLPLLTSRSCPNQCNFCAMRLVMGNRLRSRSAASVFDEIKYLYDTYGVNYFKIMDDNFTFSRERVIEICKLIINSGMKIYFDALNGISIKTLDEEVIRLMRQAGIIMLALAVESGSDYIRNEVMGKRVSRERIVNTFKMCRNVGINVCAFFIIGMPEETEETLMETANLLREIDATRVSMSVGKPIPGTKLFEQCVRDNLLVGGYDAATLWTGEAERDGIKANDGFYFQRLLDRTPWNYWIQPYNLSLDRLAQIDAELQAIAYKKSKAWIVHMTRNKHCC